MQQQCRRGGRWGYDGSQGKCVVAEGKPTPLTHSIPAKLRTHTAVYLFLIRIQGTNAAAAAVVFMVSHCNHEQYLTPPAGAPAV
jgi:hypothetical protein